MEFTEAGFHGPSIARGALRLRRRPGPRRSDDDGVSGAELAARMLALGRWGIGLRRADRCAGGLRPREVSMVGLARVPHAGAGSAPHERRPGLLFPLPVRPDRAETHARRGHDAGCACLGLPLDLIDGLLGCWDGVGAIRVIQEAVHEAIHEILADASRGGWSATYAEESLVYALERRITPRSPSTGALRDPRTHEAGPQWH